MSWRIPIATVDPLKNTIETHFGIHPTIAQLLLQRDFDSFEKVESLLQPKLSNLADPFLLPDMELAVVQILETIEQNGQIVLFGDYDVDGVTSVALLHRILLEFGAKVRSYLPNRLRTGYGLTEKGMEEAFASGKPDLLITLDCGSSSRAEIAKAYELGVRVVVLDHHECQEPVPVCEAVVNPKRGKEFRYLCTVGIAFKVAHALLKRRRDISIQLKEYLDLVAIGTIADVVPLIEENRLLAIKGLEQVSRTKWLGLKRLLEAAELSKRVRAVDISFKLAPRINAAGRLDSAEIALELMLSSDFDNAKALGDQLEQLNSKRKTLSEIVYQEAELQVEETYKVEKHYAIVVGKRDWHFGLIGIVAAKLTQKYQCPVVVIGFDNDGIGKGSARSVEGFSLIDALQKCDRFLLKHGGHHMAAGVTIAEAHLTDFREAFNSCAAQMLQHGPSPFIVAPDVELQLSDINMHLLESYEAAGPFGTNHPEPLFLLRGIHAAAAPELMKEKHRSFTFWQNGKTARAIWFNSSDEPLPPPPWDVAFTLGRNDFRGNSSPSIYIRHMRSAGV